MNDSLDRRFVVELSERAYLDFQDAQLYVRVVSGNVAAEARVRGLWELLESLETMPFRTLAPENDRFLSEVRQVTYRRPGASYQHRILFAVDVSNETGHRVNIMHIRHASKDDIGRWEASVIERQSQPSDRANGESDAE